MIYFFIRYEIFLSSKRRKAKIFQYSMGEFFKLFTNIYDQDWFAVSNAWDPNEVLCVGKQWIYRNLHALNIPSLEYSSLWLLANKFINLGIYRGYETSYFEPLIVLTQLNYLSPMVILKVGRPGFKVLRPLRGVLHIIVVKCKCKVRCSNRLTFLLEKNTYHKSYF